MNTTYTIIAVVLVLVVVGVILATIFARHNQSKQLQDQFGPEYDLAVQAQGDEKNDRYVFRAGVEARRCWCGAGAGPRRLRRGTQIFQRRQKALF